MIIIIDSYGGRRQRAAHANIVFSTVSSVGGGGIRLSRYRSDHNIFLDIIQCILSKLVCLLFGRAGGVARRGRRYCVASARLDAVGAAILWSVTQIHIYLVSRAHVYLFLFNGLFLLFFQNLFINTFGWMIVVKRGGDK